MAKLENYFTEAGGKLGMRTTEIGSKNKTGGGNMKEQNEGVNLTDKTVGRNEQQGVDKMEMRGEETLESSQTDESLKLSIVETQPEEKERQSNE